MSTSTFFLSKASVRNLKRAAARKVTGISSAHLSEAVAAAVGFRTNAALLAAFKNRSTVEVSKPNNLRLRARLRELGYLVHDDLQLLPELELSYTPYKRFPLRANRTPRWCAWRNLMVAAVNAGLEQRLFGLSPLDNWWQGGSSESYQCSRAAYHFLFDNDLPAVASVDAISGDELSINVLVNPRDPTAIPQWYSGLSDADAAAHGWIERRLGAWLQDGGEAFHCKRTLLPRIAHVTIAPLGYSDQGSFIL